MPNGIVTELQFAETCPAPACNMSGKEVERFVDELESYAKLFEPAFCRREQWAWGRVYLRGLLGDTQRKKAE
jgi:hypothetical protein